MVKFFLKKIYKTGLKRGINFGFKEGFEKGRRKGNKGFVSLNPGTFRKYLELHKKVFNFALKVNQESYRKYQPPVPESEKNVLVRGCLYKIGEWIVILHHAILSLCEDGWASVTPILIRSMLDCLVNTIAILNPKYDSEYMTFKFYSHEFLNSMIREEIQSVLDFNKRQVGEIIKRMCPKNQKRAKIYVDDFLKKKKHGAWWFKPEYESTKEILAQCDEKYDMYFFFQILSAVTHSSFFGFGLFKDKPDKIDINPRSDPRSTRQSLVFSSRLLLEMSNIRNEFEELGCDSIYESLIKKLVSLKKDFFDFGHD